ncbi:MAG: hypothetical protein ACRD7E_12570 [Bryobacteraceae bacterium]
MSAISAQAARRGIKGKKNLADLPAPRESVVRQVLESRREFLAVSAVATASILAPVQTLAAASSRFA